MLLENGICGKTFSACCQRDRNPDKRREMDGEKDGTMRNEPHRFSSFQNLFHSLKVSSFSIIRSDVKFFQLVIGYCFTFVHDVSMLAKLSF